MWHKTLNSMKKKFFFELSQKNFGQFITVSFARFMAIVLAIVFLLLLVKGWRIEINGVSIKYHLMVLSLFFSIYLWKTIFFRKNLWKLLMASTTMFATFWFFSFFTWDWKIILYYFGIMFVSGILMFLAAFIPDEPTSP